MEVVEVTDEEGNYYKYKKYDGRPYHPLVKGNVKDQLQLLENYEFRDDDVFLCSFPKSGGAHFNIKPKLVDSSKWTRVYKYRVSPAAVPELTGFTTLSLRTGSVEYNGRHVLLESHDISELDTLERPRTVVTHMTYGILPLAIKHGVGKIVYIMRNPKDVFVSMKCFYDSLKTHVYAGNMDGLLRVFLSDEFGFGIGGSWFTHTREWGDGKASNAARIHTVTYEKLKKDTYGEIEKLAKFLEIEYDDSLLRDIVENSVFDKLKAAHATEAGATDQWRHVCEDGRLPVYRKGIIGDWRNLLTISQNRLFDAVIQEKLSGRNIDILYQ